MLAETKDPRGCFQDYPPVSASASAGLLYLVNVCSVLRADFSLLQHNWEMAPQHRFSANAADGKMLEKPGKTKQSDRVLIANLAGMCPFTR